MCTSQVSAEMQSNLFYMRIAETWWKVGVIRNSETGNQFSNSNALEEPVPKQSVSSIRTFDGILKTSFIRNGLQIIVLLIRELYNEKLEWIYVV